MAQLTKRMYAGTSAADRDNLLFGLYSGQMREGNTKVINNGGWYNKFCEKLGFGDLSIKDIKRISDELEDGELFIVISEPDCFWIFDEHPKLSAVRPSVKVSGIDYVMERVVYIIARNKLYYIDHHGGPEKESSIGEYLLFRIMRPDTAKELMSIDVPA